jgi:hypothetical protein
LDKIEQVDKQPKLIEPNFIAEIPGIEVEGDFEPISGKQPDVEPPEKSTTAERATVARRNSGCDKIVTRSAKPRGVDIGSRNEVIEIEDSDDKSDGGVYQEVKKEIKMEIFQVEDVDSDSDSESEYEDNPEDDPEHDTDGDRMPVLRKRRDKDSHLQDRGSAKARTRTKQGRPGMVKKPREKFIPVMKGRTQRHNEGVYGVNCPQASSMKVECEADRFRSKFAGAGYSTKRGVIHLQFDDNAPPPSHMIGAQLDAHILGVILVQKYSLKKGLEIFCDRASVAMVKELSEIHGLEVYEPILASDLSWEEKKQALESLLMITEKCNGIIKAR